MDNITQEQIDALIEFIDNTEEPASITNVMAAAILAFLNLKVQQMVTVDDLNNEATARENADSLLQGLIDALNQTAVRYSDVGEVVPELGGLGMLALNQSPLVIFKSMGAAFDGVSMEVTLLNGEAKYGGTGIRYIYNRRGTVGSYPLTTNKVYFNSYTGRLYRWNGTAFDAIGGGMDTAIYEIIKSNVNLVASKLDALISALAMLAFSDSVNKNTLKVGTLSWVEPETHTPRLTSPVAGSTIDFGTTDEDQDQITKNIFIQGADLTTGLTLAITEGAELFTLAGGSSSISKSGALDGTNITIIYTSSSSVATATGKLRIYSNENNEVDVTVNLLGKYSEQGGGDEPTPSDTVDVITHLLNMTKTSGGNTATKGSPYTAEITTTSPCTYNGDLRVYMGGVNITSQCTITDITAGVKRIVTPNVTGDIMIIATARTGTVTVKSSALIDLKINGNAVNYETSGDDYIYTWSGDSISSINVGSISNFINVTSLKEVDFGGVPLSALFQLFQGCTGLTKVENMVLHAGSQAHINGLFSDCTSLASITGLNTWNVELVTSVAYMFSGIPLTSLDISGWVCNNITSVANMFATSALTDINIGYFNTGTITAENGLTSALSISGSTVTIHCKSKTPPILNPDNNWLKNRSTYSPYLTSKTVYVKCPANCLAAYQAGAGWDSVGYNNGSVPQLSEES